MVFLKNNVKQRNNQQMPKAKIRTMASNGVVKSWGGKLERDFHWEIQAFKSACQGTYKNQPMNA